MHLIGILNSMLCRVFSFKILASPPDFIAFFQLTMIPTAKSGIYHILNCKLRFIKFIKNKNRMWQM